MDRTEIASHISSHTLFNVLTNLFRVIIGGLVLIFIARQLGPSEYGIVSLGLSIAAIAGIFCDFGVSTSTAYFLAKNGSQHNLIYKNGRTLKIFFSFLFSIVLFLLSKPISILLNLNSPTYIQIVCFLIFIVSLLKFSTTSLQGIKRTDKLALLNFLQTIINNALIFVIVYIGYKAKGVLFGYSISTAIIWTISLIVLHKYFKIFNINFNKQVLKRIFLYALPLLLTSSSYYLLLRGPAVLLSAFTGTNEVSFLNIPLRIVELASLPAYSLSLVTAPFFTKKAQGAETLPWLYVKIIKYSLFFYLPVAVFLILSASRLISVFFGTEYSNAANVLLIFSFYLPFFAITTSTSRILDFLGLAKQKSIIFAITAASTIISSFVVIPGLKEIGAALVIAVPYTLFSIYTILKSSKECGVRLNKYLMKLAKLILITGVSCLPAAVILHYVSAFTGLLMSFICFVVLFSISVILSRLIKFSEFSNLFKLLKYNA